MKTIKLIDLLVKIANKEELPIKIKYGSTIYEFSEVVINYVQNNIVLFDKYFFENCSLNDEVEIIEEPKKIELLESVFCWSVDSVDNINKAFRDLSRIVFEQKDKLNEVINKLNYLLEKSDKDGNKK